MSQLLERFLSPSPRFSPAPIWWWSGEPLNVARLREQLESMVDVGIHNVVIINLAPSGPLYGSDADEPPFATEGWWEVFRDVCERATELGVSIWFYDQIGFSGANLQAQLVREQPDFTGWSLEHLSREGVGTVELACPSGAIPVAACAERLHEGGRSSRDLVAVQVIDGQASISGDGTYRLHLFSRVPRGFDYFSPKACAALLDKVHGEFERQAGDLLGSTIVGSFQDELPNLPTWSADFEHRFRARFGYDLGPRLLSLWEGEDEESASVRVDYHGLRAELAETAFFRPHHDWHAHRGLICGVDQQDPARAGYPVDTVATYADYMRTHRWYGAPGSDHHGDAKIHSSLAHLHGRERTWLEAFHSTGWGGTLEETFDWLLPWLRRGATLYNPHAVYYSTRGGWWEWAPPSTCWRQPYWRHYSSFARIVQRLCSVLSAGRHVCDVAVLFPTTTVQSAQTLGGALSAGHAAHSTYLDLVGRSRWFEPSLGVLDAARRDFDVLDEDSLQRGRIVQGGLQVADETFRAVVLPACRRIQAATALMLDAFVRAGGLLVAVGQPPQGRHGDNASLEEHFRAGRARLVEIAADVPEALSDLPRRVDAAVPTLVRRVGASTLVLVPAAETRATMVTRLGHPILDWFRVSYEFDPGRYHRKLMVRVRGVNGDPQVWCPVTGTRRQLRARSLDDGVEVDVPLHQGPVALLVFGEDTSVPDIEEDAQTKALELDGLWDVQVESTLDNRWGDFSWPAAGLLPVQCWELSHTVVPPDRRVEADWTDVHATFGPHGRWIGPLPEPELPAPGTSADEWRDAVYSLSRGIHKDRLHEAVLGPKGHVPEEFLDLGDVETGDGVQYCFYVELDRPIRAAAIVVGAPARKRIWLDGHEIDVDDEGYLSRAGVDLPAGVTRVDVRLIAEAPTALRAHVAFVRSFAAYQRPEWLSTSGRVDTNALVTFFQTLNLDGRPDQAVVNVASPSPCRLLVNGAEAGRQGGFDPYFETQGVTRLDTYHIESLLQAGTNIIAVEVTAHDREPRAIVDALFVPRDDEVTLQSDSTWSCSIDGAPAPLRTHRQQWIDPASVHVRRRAHPLFETKWLERTVAPARDVVLPLVPAPRPATPPAAWFDFTIPPGATMVRVAAHGSVSLEIDGAPVPAAATGANGRADFPVPRHDGLARPALLRVVGTWGREAGAALAGPIEFDLGPGRMRLGDWASQGLVAFSGIVRYKRVLSLTPSDLEAPIVLDLGRVRGTAEVSVNGRTVGTRVLSPFRFEIGSCLVPGDNQLEIEVTNTLAPYLDAVSPTHFVLPGQNDSGLFGPVRLLVGRAAPRSRR
jgi:hypothetical protein